MKQVPDRIKLRRVDRGGHREKPGTANDVGCWVGMAGACLVVWAVLSPLFYEQFFIDLRDGHDGWGVIALALCFIVPMLLVGVHATRKVVQKTREQYSPPVTPDTFPANEILVRGSEEPPVAQSEILLRAAQKGEETPKEELLRVSQE
jgi:hypothetical protein